MNSNKENSKKDCCEKCGQVKLTYWNAYRKMFLCSYCKAFAYDDDDWAELDEDAQ